MLRALSDILSNSSMQHTPLSLRTSAPLSSTISLVSGSCRQPLSDAAQAMLTAQLLLTLRRSQRAQVQQLQLTLVT